ncbi:hypothetical protein [Paenibacillus sp. IHB B 3084]|uniref:hypothetical protein n=1 Tax=Paenibacillus sp. IHB B 3084 TaxID=867076 RepID=UPI000B22A099|nr:hypothetical protein [Paenibacillus sp. IHB B 3084]
MEHTLVQIARTPEILLRDIRLLTATEEADSPSMERTIADYPAGTFHGIFEAQAERIPEQTAVIYEDTELTYHELNERPICCSSSTKPWGPTRTSRRRDA